ncbi:hypothetical protein D3C85_1280770 [compost metagenome]
MLHRGNFLNGYVSYGLREPGLDLIYALPLVQLLDNLLEHILTLGLPCNLCLPIVNKLAHDDLLLFNIYLRRSLKCPHWGEGRNYGNAWTFGRCCFQIS